MRIVPIGALQRLSAPLRAVALVGLLGIATCAFAPPLPVPDSASFVVPDPARWHVDRIEAKAIDEPSGSVRSRQWQDVYWTHNDSGSGPSIFAITGRGEWLGQWRIENAENEDWEDIAIDDAGNLYVGDIGNNLNRRRNLGVYRIPEPDPRSRGGRARADLHLRYRYSDQRGFPRASDFNFDAEALFFMSDALWILTKNRTNYRSRLYRLEIDGEVEEQVLEPLMTLDLRGKRRPRPEARGVEWVMAPVGNVTGADFSPELRSLAVASYRAIFFFEPTPDGPHPLRPVRRIDLDSRRTRQVESVAWDDSDLVFGNEGGWLFRIPDALEAPIDSYPPTRVGETR